LIIRRLIVPLTVALVTAHAGQVLAQGAFPAPLPNQAAGTANDPAFPPVNGAPRRSDPAFPPVNSALRGSDPAFPPVNGALRGSDPAFPPVNGAGRATGFARPAPTSFPVNGAAPVGGAAPMGGGGFGGAPAPPSQAGGDQCMKEFIPLREDAEKRGKLIKAASEHHATPQEACKLIEAFGQSEIRMIKYVETHASKCGIPPTVLDQLKGGHKNSESMQQKVCNAASQMQARGGPAGPSLSDVLGSAAALPEATKSKKGGSTFDTLNGNVLTR
jgi:hypothetical protein